MELLTQYLINNPCYTAGRSIRVRGLMLHSIGTPQPDPLVLMRNWNQSTYRTACVHGFIGEDAAYITLPCLEETATSGPGRAHRGWHGGGSSNDTHIGVEMCEPACLTYVGGADFICSDRTAAVAFVEKTTRAAVLLFARLCEYHGLDPLADGVILSHAEGYQRGIATNHADPAHLWRQLGMAYDMDQFRADVAARIREGESVTQDQFNAMMDTYLAGLAEQAPADWSREAREWAESSGIILGDSSGRKQYRAFCTREQMVTFLMRLSEKLSHGSIG